MSEFLHQSSKALILWLSLAFCGSSAFAIIQRYSPMGFSKDESLFFIGCLWALCVVGFLRCLKKRPAKTEKEKSVNYSNVLRVTIINLCLSFSLMGGALFVYPLVKLTTAKDIVLFLLTMVYFIPHSFLLYVAIENLCKATATQLSHVERKMSKKQLLLRFSLYFFAIYAICLLYNLAYNPSIMFWDSYYQVAQAKGVLPYDNWHPLFTTFMIQGLLKINDSLSFVVLMQDVYWTAVLAGIAFWFAVRTNRWVLPVSCAMLFTLMPNQGLAVATILKDVPYMATLLWLTFILFRLIVEGNRWIHRKIFYFEIVTALTVITLVRTNGFVASVCVACCLFVITKYKKQMTAALGCVALILLCWYGPIMQSVKQVYNSPGTKYLALVDDIMTLHINGVALPEETADFMEQCTDIQRVQTYYAQDPTYFDNLCDYEFIDRNKTTVQLLTMYMDTYLRHPILMTRQILTRMLVGWDVSERLGRSTAVGITEYAQGNTVFENFPDYYGDRTENILTKLLDQLNEWTLRSPQRMFFWRTGFFVVLLVAELLIANCFGVLKRTLVLFTPVFAHMIGIVLCVIWSNYRYYWPIEAVALLGVPMLGAIIYTSKYSKESAHEKKI